MRLTGGVARQERPTWTNTTAWSACIASRHRPTPRSVVSARGASPLRQSTIAWAYSAYWSSSPVPSPVGDQGLAEEPLGLLGTVGFDG